LRHQTAVALTPRKLESGSIVTTTKGGRVVVLPVTPRIEVLVRVANARKGEEDCRFVDLLNNRRMVQGVHTIQERWCRWKKQAGLPPGLRIHDLRRDAAHRLYAACHDVRQVQGMLGHVNPITTLRYLHIAAPQASAEAVQQALITEVA
jgi:integrase